MLRMFERLDTLESDVIKTLVAILNVCAFIALGVSSAQGVTTAMGFSVTINDFNTQDDKNKL